MSGLKNGMPRPVIDVGSRSDTDAAHHSSQLVGNIITVQVQSGNDRVFFGNKQGILQKGIGNAILDNKTSLRYVFSKLTLRQLIAPFLEAAFGKLHDIAFVYQCYRGQTIFERITASRTHQPLRSLFRHWFHAKR